LNQKSHWGTTKQPPCSFVLLENVVQMDLQWDPKDGQRWVTQIWRCQTPWFHIWMETTIWLH
jgi:hypothetical protein